MSFRKIPLFALCLLSAPLAVPAEAAGTASAEAPQERAAGTQKAEISALPASGLPKTWLQGDPAAEWDEETLFVFEFWATWCGPCLAAIPHLNALHRQILEEKLPARLVGVNVYDSSSVEKLKKFLAARPVPPAYAIAVDTGKNTAREWLRPLKVSGIPFALALRGGKIVWKGNPNALSGELLRELCSSAPREEKRSERDVRAQMIEIMRLFADPKRREEATPALTSFLADAAVPKSDKIALAGQLYMRALCAGDFRRMNALLRLEAETFPDDFRIQSDVARFILETDDVPREERDLALARECLERADALAFGEPGKKVDVQTRLAEVFASRGEREAELLARRRAWEASPEFARIAELSEKLPAARSGELARVLAGESAVPADFFRREKPRGNAEETPGTDVPAAETPRDSDTPEARDALAFLASLDWVRGAAPRALPANGVVFLEIWTAPDPGPFNPLWHRVPAQRLDGILGEAAERVPVFVLALEHSDGRVEKTLAFPRFATARPVANLSAAGADGEAFLKKLGVGKNSAVVALRDGKVIWNGDAQSVPMWLAEAARRGADPEPLRARDEAAREEYVRLFRELVALRPRIFADGDDSENAARELSALRERLGKHPTLDMIAGEILAGTFYSRKDYAGVGAICTEMLEKYPNFNFIAEHQLKILTANQDLRAENLPALILAYRNIIAAGTPHESACWLQLSRIYEENGEPEKAVFAAALAREASRAHASLRAAEERARER